MEYYSNACYPKHHILFGRKNSSADTNFGY